MREYIEGLVRGAIKFTIGVSTFTARVLLSYCLVSITDISIPFGAQRHKSRKTET